MKITRTYQKGCDWCNATGHVTNPNPNWGITGTELTIICPVCNGSKTVIVTEIIEDNNPPNKEK